MLQRCVDLTWLSSGKFIINCFVAGWMFLTGVRSIMNMDVAPVSAIARDVAVFISLRYWGVGAPNRCLAVAANDGQEASCADIACWAVAAGEQFDMAIVTSSLLCTVTMFTIWVESEGWAEIKLLHLFAMYSFAAHVNISVFGSWSSPWCVEPTPHLGILVH